jgi:hypothetical protein
MLDEATPELRRPNKPALEPFPAMHPGPFDEAGLFGNFEQYGKRNLLDLYNVSFFCGVLNKRGKPIGDIGLDDLINSQSSRVIEMQKDIIWTATATIKDKDRAYKHLHETGQLNRIVAAAGRGGVYIDPPQWKTGVEIRIKGKYERHGFGGKSLEGPITDY